MLCVLVCGDKHITNRTDGAAVRVYDPTKLPYKKCLQAFRIGQKKSNIAKSSHPGVVAKKIHDNCQSDGYFGFRRGARCAIQLKKIKRA